MNAALQMAHSDVPQLTTSARWMTVWLNKPETA